MRNLPTTAIPGVDWEPDAFADGTLPFVREQKLDECGPDFEDSVTEHGILTPVFAHYDRAQNVTTLLNGHHRYFMAEELGVPIAIGWFVSDLPWDAWDWDHTDAWRASNDETHGSSYR